MMERADDDLPLAGIRIVDATTELGGYPGRLFGDLGADVVRLEVPIADAEGRGGQPVVAGLSARTVFVTLGRRGVVLDPDDPDDAQRLDELLGGARMLLTSEPPSRLRERGLHPDDVADRYPGLVHVAMTPYGLDGPYAERPAGDLTLLAAGGLLHLAGEPDRAPVRPAGEQSMIVTGLHAAVGALLALLVQDETGTGQIVDVSAQQAVAHSLENAVQYVDLEGVVRGRTAGTATEVGNGLFRCRDGWVYLVAGIGGTPLGWDGVLDWIESGETDTTSLRDPQWRDPPWRRTPGAATQFRKLFEDFAADQTKAQLYEDGQARGVSVAPVADPVDLLASPQLRDRDFFRYLEIDGQLVTVPGAPYRFAGLEVGPRAPAG